MKRIEECGLRVAVVTTDDYQLHGVVTDGDIRRGILEGLSLDCPVSQVMNETPIVAHEEDDQDTVVQLMTENAIHQVPVVDDHGRVVRLETIDEIALPEERSTPVIIMAGGLGTRLRPITDNRPKPLVEVEGEPILEMLLRRLAAQGFRDVYLSVNYEADMIEEHFGNGSEWNVQIEYLREDERLGTAGSLSLLPKRPQEPMLVLNGDLLTTLDFGRIVDFHSERSAVATMGVRRYRKEIPYGVIELDNHRITNIEEKPTEQYFVNAGIYILEPGTLEYVPNEAFFDMTELFQELMSTGEEITAYPIQEYWRDIGKREDLDRAEEEFDQVFG